MIRKKIFKLPATGFTERGTEILRIEALSDAVFAFSVSLLVAALEVPQTFEELRVILNGAIPFFATVAMIFLFWYQQYKFFRRYGLNDVGTILLNLAYLAVILFYVYPLKFLFAVLLTSWTGIDLFPHATEKGLPILQQEDFSQLIIFFSIGYAVLWLLLLLMYQRALSASKRMELTPFEILVTKKERRGAFLNVCVGLASMLLAFAGQELLSGICYLLIPLLMVLNNRKAKQKNNITANKAP
ncbi:MAG TPA: TMEM175 family protein [Chitinophagaceae bacterium]|nr:TMEM175 family protein [Chitinophagaceae bacterium]HNU15897.1 TMEM175 family protein [Chitinophagaceae bacterium]